MSRLRILNRKSARPLRLAATILGCCFIVALSGCDLQDMYDQPKVKPLRGSDFFLDGRSARPVVEGTVARGSLHDDEALFTGKLAGHVVDTFPMKVTEADLARGKERYQIYCTPCHDRLGSGDGVVVRRGYLRPPSIHTDRLRNAPIGHFVDVMTSGFGSMPSYAVQVEPLDRWRIAAYIRALQLSQHATLEMVPEDKRAQLNSEK